MTLHGTAEHSEPRLVRWQRRANAWYVWEEAGQILTRQIPLSLPNGDMNVTHHGTTQTARHRETVTVRARWRGWLTTVTKLTNFGRILSSLKNGS